MFNQQSLEDAFVFYNSITEKDRKEIEKILNKVMSFSIWGNLELEIEPKMLIRAEKELLEEENGNDIDNTNEG
jgi:hypothetical protein